MIPAVARKVAEVAPAATVTDPLGAGKSVLLLVSDTATPPAAAEVLKVTVHVVTPSGMSVVGVHASDCGIGGATRLIVMDFDTPFNVAVSVAL
jgi:hypothetical protein